MKPMRLIAPLLCLCLALSLAGCGLAERFFGSEDELSAADEPAQIAEMDPEYPVSAGGATVLARPGKVVSLAPSLTEKLFDLGMEDRLVGVSDYCDYPGAAKDLIPCGTAQIPDIAVIVSLEPHLVLTEAELPEETMETLAGLDIPVAVFPHAASVLDLLYTYEDIARLMDGETSGLIVGGIVADQMEDRLNYMRSVLTPYTEEAGRKTALYLRLMDFTVATGDTFEHELMQFICLDNAAAEHTDWTYPADVATSSEGLADFAQIDVIFMDEDFVTITDLEESDFYKGLPATIQDRYFYVSSIALERQSMRTISELAKMAEYAYSDAVSPGMFNFDYGSAASLEDLVVADSEEDWAAEDQDTWIVDDADDGDNES